MASINWCVLFFNVIQNPLTIIIYIFAPINSVMFCRIDHAIATATLIHAMLLHNAIIIVKYLFVFHLKNPTAVQDDFWRIFINLWIFIFNASAHTLYQMYPGREQNAVVLCYGKLPLEHVKQSIKRIYVFFIITLLTIGLHYIFWIYNLIIKHCYTTKYEAYKSFENRWAKVVSKENMFDYASHSIALLILLLCGHYIPDNMGSLHPSQLEIYPNYIYIFINDNVLAPGWILLSYIILLTRNQKLRKEVWSQIIDTFNYR